MILLPDPNTAYVDPFRARKTLVLHCFVADPVTGESYTRDPRYVAKKAEEYLQVHRHRRHRLLRARARVLRLRRRPLRVHGRTRPSTWSTRSRASGTPAATRGRNLGYKPRTKQGYFPVPPMDHYQDLRSEMAATLMELGIEVELHHHEVATGGQGEIGTQFNTLLAMADQLMTFKYVLKNVAWPARQDAHVHAQAALRGQRLGHAHPPVAVEGRRAAVLRRDRLRRPVRHGPLVHRRPAAPRPVDPAPSPPRPPTATSGSCRATRRR